MGDHSFDVKCPHCKREHKVEIASCEACGSLVLVDDLGAEICDVCGGTFCYSCLPTEEHECDTPAG